MPGFPALFEPCAKFCANDFMVNRLRSVAVDNFQKKEFMRAADCLEMRSRNPGLVGKRRDG